MILNKEIKLISDSKLQRAARKLISNYSELLAIQPASTSGKYHPPDERGPGGLALHIRRMAHVLYKTAEHFGLTDKERDVLVFCALAHDISNLEIKDLTDRKMLSDSDYFRKWHGSLSSQIATEYLINVGYNNEDETLLIIQGILQSHMGYWSPGFRQPVNNKLEIIFSMADYVTTRENVLIKI